MWRATVGVRGRGTCVCVGCMCSCVEYLGVLMVILVGDLIVSSVFETFRR